jgi:hypothetical protein
LTLAERNVYFGGIQGGMAALEAARAVVVQALRRIETAGPPTGRLTDAILSPCLFLKPSARNE